MYDIVWPVWGHTEGMRKRYTRVVVDAEEKYLEEINSLFHEAFADIIPNIKAIFGYDWKTPLECEVKFGPNFKDMEKVK